MSVRNAHSMARLSVAAQGQHKVHEAQLKHLGLDLDVIRVSCTARRLLALPPQVSQVGSAALVEREAVTFPLDHAFGFELADVVREQSRCSASADALTVACFLDRDQEADLAMSDDQRRRS
jgi:hypothetical protein